MVKSRGQLAHLLTTPVKIGETWEDVSILWSSGAYGRASGKHLIGGRCTILQSESPVKNKLENVTIAMYCNLRRQSLSAIITTLMPSLKWFNLSVASYSVFTVNTLRYAVTYDLWLCLTVPISIMNIYIQYMVM